MINVVTDKFNSIIIEDADGNPVRIDEGDDIELIADSGVHKTGVLMKIVGSAKERKLQILPSQSECEEVWSLYNIADGSLKVIDRTKIESEDSE